MRPTMAPPPPTTTRPTTPPTIPPDLDRSPLGHYLLHPQHTLAAIARTLMHHAAGITHRSGLWLLLVAMILLAARLALARWQAARLHAGARLVQILPPPQVDPDGATALWRNLAGLLRQHRLLQGRPYVAFEYHWTPDGLTIALWLPGMVAPRLVERAIEAAWPGARTRTTTPAPPPLPVGQRAASGALRLAQPEWYPLRGQTEHPTDPLRALLGAAEELGGGESAIVQVLVRPARGRRLARCRRVARALRRGQHPTRAGRLLDLLNPTTTTMGSRRAHTDDPARHADVQAITRKAATPGFQVAIRYGVATTVERNPRGRLRARAHALAAAFAIHAGRNRLARTHHPSRLALRALGGRLGRGILLSLDELAALAHLPWDRGVPGLERAGARSVAPPPNAPRQGKVLGDADTGPARPIALDPADARQHVHLVGATGSGKSTLLGNLVLQDVDAGRGVILVCGPWRPAGAPVGVGGGRCRVGSCRPRRPPAATPVAVGWSVAVAAGRPARHR